MSSQQKRVVWVAVVSLVLIAVGIAMWVGGNGRYDQTLHQEVSAFDRHRGPAKELDVDDFARHLAIDGLIIGLGPAFTVSGVIGLLISAAVWVKKPAPGSVLTLRGWKTAEEYGEKAIAAGKAWQTVIYGIWGGLTWIGPIWLGLFSLARTYPKVTTPIFAIILVQCSVLYGAGISQCWRRDRAKASMVKWPWRLALVLNYGGLCAFLVFVSALLVLRVRS